VCFSDRFVATCSDPSVTECYHRRIIRIAVLSSGGLDTVRADYNCLNNILPPIVKDYAPRRIEDVKKSPYRVRACVVSSRSVSLQFYLAMHLDGPRMRGSLSTD
jgi:hypothetical protein